MSAVLWQHRFQTQEMNGGTKVVDGLQVFLGANKGWGGREGGRGSSMCEHYNTSNQEKSFPFEKFALHFPPRPLPSPRGKQEQPGNPGGGAHLNVAQTEQQQSPLLFKCSPEGPARGPRPNPSLHTSERDKTVRRIEWKKENKQLARERVSDQMKFKKKKACFLPSD